MADERKHNEQPSINKDYYYYYYYYYNRLAKPENLYVYQVSREF